MIQKRKGKIAEAVSLRGHQEMGARNKWRNGSAVDTGTDHPFMRQGTQWSYRCSYMGKGDRQSHMFDFYRVQFMMQDYFFSH